MALAIANRKNMNNSLSVNQMTPSGAQFSGQMSIGKAQPPRNRIVPIAHIVPMATYSPSMNIMYGVEPYSTMKPATSSDSASTRSKGGRFVAPSPETKKTTNTGNSHSQYQPNRPQLVSCASTIADRLSEPTQSSTVTNT